MANKPLVIDVESNAIPPENLNIWAPFQAADKFISNIQTPALSKGTNIGTLVSGIPTAFARVDLFTTALAQEASGGADNATARNLAGYYHQLADEWRGFVAAIALDYDSVSVRHVDLAYSDGKSLAHTANIYEPAGAFGNMLLERSRRWSPVTDDANAQTSPRINIIRYDGQIVGATAPECLLFTSTGYRIKPSEKRPWVDKATGKFADPLKSALSEDQTAALNAYVSNILEHLDQAENYYRPLNDDGISYTALRTLLERWREEIQEYSRSHNYNISIGSIPPVAAPFGEPFDKIFNYKDQLYGVEGRIREKEGEEGALLFDPRTLLLPTSARIARVAAGSAAAKDPKVLAQNPVYLLRADVKGEDGQYAYFALPLSAQGLNVYGKTIGALVGMALDGTRVDSTLTAVYDPAPGVEHPLQVTLCITTEGGVRRKYSQSYAVGLDPALQSKDILIWPNFISRQWHAYFLFSELPHNTTLQSYAAFPFVGDTDDDFFRIITNEDGAPQLLADKGEIIAPQDKVKASLEICETNASASNSYKYEIYRSNKPFKGIRLLSPTGEEGGYLIINYSTDPNSRLPHNMLNVPRNLKPVNLGVDFGSTNTSIAYSNPEVLEQGFLFHNRRVSLMDKQQQFPAQNQVLFFSANDKPVASNAVKSVLTIHDDTRLPEVKGTETRELMLHREAVGGFPCLVDNLPVCQVSEADVILEYPSKTRVRQIHNMKWNDDKLDMARRTAFLRGITLQTYAELFVRELVPTRLKWSYPSSMSNALVGSYGLIWDELKHLKPVTDTLGKSIALEVSTAPIIVASSSTSSFAPQGFDAIPQGFGNLPQGFGNLPQGFGNLPDGFDQTPQGFGQAPEGFGNNTPDVAPSKGLDLRPEDPNRVINYDPRPLLEANDNTSLTEATAVANYASSNTKLAGQSNVLTLCMDIGGSTTDISALYILDKGLTMVKQNSLRFAAQQISRATSHIPGFQSVLEHICSKFDIRMVGLNFPPKTYTDHMAPYFFDQIVDRLEPSQLTDFYKEIRSNCPVLMAVDLYVTGLLMFYAGQVVNKLVDDLRHLDPAEKRKDDSPRPYVQISFAGKGSRIFQWLSALDQKAASDYYYSMFGYGYGGAIITKELAAFPLIQYPTASNSADIKYEVSKGLAKANTLMFSPATPTPAEIIGEEGFTLTAADGSVAKVPSSHSFTPEMMGAIGLEFGVPAPMSGCPRLANFLLYYNKALKEILSINIPDKVYTDGLADMNICGYVKNLPEFRQAEADALNNNAPFDFVAPIIVLEGKKFYETHLLKALTQSAN